MKAHDVLVSLGTGFQLEPFVTRLIPVILTMRVDVHIRVPFIGTRQPFRRGCWRTNRSGVIAGDDFAVAAKRLSVKVGDLVLAVGC